MAVLQFVKVVPDVFEDKAKFEPGSTNQTFVCRFLRFARPAR